MIVLRHEGMESIVDFNVITDKFVATLIYKDDVTGINVEADTVEKLDSVFCEEVEYYLENIDGE